MKGLGALLIVGGALFLFLAYTNSIAGVLSALFGGTPAAPVATAITDPIGSVTNPVIGPPTGSFTTGTINPITGKPYVSK
jgi:drug/metabolite transporter (DMT)-like permease